MKVKNIKKGINPSSVNEIYFSGDYLLKGFRIGVVAGMIGLTVSQSQNPSEKNFIISYCTLFFLLLCCCCCYFLWIYQEAIAIGRTFAAMKDYQLDGNKEMVALGAMNVVGSMTSCYVATGGQE